MNRIALACGLAAGSGLVLSMSGTARAASVFTYSAQTRSVGAQVNGLNNAPSDKVKDSATGFGPYAGNQKAVDDDAFYGNFDAGATQSSTLSADGIRASGILSAHNAPSGDGDGAGAAGLATTEGYSQVDVSFTLAQSELLTFDQAVQSSGSFAANGDVDAATDSLKDAAGNDVFVPVEITGLQAAAPATGSFTRTLLLAPGAYQFKAAYLAYEGASGGGAGGASTASYHLSLITAPAQVVPLPPAAWSGLATLAGLGGVAAVRRRAASRPAAV